MSEVGKILLEMEKYARYQDGQVTVPAYLAEQLHNEVFPDSPKHDYTEVPK